MEKYIKEHQEKVERAVAELTIRQEFELKKHESMTDEEKTQHQVTLDALSKQVKEHEEYNEFLKTKC